MISTSFRVGIQVKKWFFDSVAVLAKLAPHKRAALSKAGAYVRTRSRSLLRRRKGTSRPGDPPNIHSPAPRSGNNGSFGPRSIASLRYILFAFDGESSVIVGPVGHNKQQLLNGEYRSGTIPELLEKGGTAGIAEKLENIAPQKAQQRGRGRDAKGRFTRGGGASQVLSQRQLAAIVRKRQQARANQTYQPGTNWVPLGRKALPGQPTRIRRAHYAARPYMSKALELENPNFADIVAGSVSAAA